MAQATFHFPKDFSWGTATSSHQVEGQNTNNNWYAWERKGHIVDDHACGLACDWWNGRWKEDFDRAAESGQNAHRLSIEWSRIQPTPDRWDEDALDYYRQMVRGLVERGLQPMVTLHHFTDPYWLTEMGAWENSTIIDDFAAYTRKVVDALKEYVSLWCTINEPNVYTTMGYIMGVFPPGEKDVSTAFRVMANMLKGHAAAYHAIHDAQPDARVGMAINYRGMNPARNWFPPDRWVANLISRLYNDFFPQAATDGVMRFLFNRESFPAAKGTQDFLGINYYTRELVAFNPFAPNDLFSKRYFDPDSELSETGFIANEPEGFLEALRWGMQYNKPIIVTENGVEDPEDSFRRRYLIEHIHKLWQGVNRSWPIEGYYYWSLVDNFEWERGWTQRFGLWELDVETQARRKRPSADLYAAICKQNALSSEMVAEFAPELSEKIFPG
jgi:beta-glucosidase